MKEKNTPHNQLKKMGVVILTTNYYRFLLKRNKLTNKNNY